MDSQSPESRCEGEWKSFLNPDGGRAVLSGAESRFAVAVEEAGGHYADCACLCAIAGTGIP